MFAHHSSSLSHSSVRFGDVDVVLVFCLLSNSSWAWMSMCLKVHCVLICMFANYFSFVFGIVFDDKSSSISFFFLYLSLFFSNSLWLKNFIVCRMHTVDDRLMKKNRDTFNWWINHFNRCWIELLQRISWRNAFPFVFRLKSSIKLAQITEIFNALDWWMHLRHFRSLQLGSIISTGNSVISKL